MTFLLLIVCLVLLVLNHSSLKRIEKRLKEDDERPDTIPFRAALLAFLMCPLAEGYCQEPRTAPPMQAMHIEAPTRAWYRNPDGSCVQMAFGMCGCNGNDLNAASLPYDTPFGKAERGGSLPSRVERYCDARGIQAWSVTGASIDDTMPWIEWSARTGRFAAVGLTEAHFQTLYGFDPRTREYFVCDNNSPHKIDRYSERQFREMHRACMPWCVILKKPSSPPPQIVKWWK